MGLMDMVIVRIDKGFSGKHIIMLRRIMMRVRLKLGLLVRTMSIDDLLALVMVINMRVGVWPVEMVVTGVVRVIAWGWIVLWHRLM